MIKNTPNDCDMTVIVQLMINIVQNDLKGWAFVKLSKCLLSLDKDIHQYTIHFKLHSGP